VVHNLTSIKAIENAMGIQVSEETKKLREVMEHAQIIHSHALHLFFLSLADFLDMDNDIKLIETYPEETKKAVSIREYGMDIIRTIGGRVVHPIANEVGGFKKAPNIEELKKIAGKSDEILQEALDLGEFFRKIKIPEFSRKTEYICLSKNGKYAIYDGDIVSSEGLNIPVGKFENNFQELQKQNEVIKKLEHAGHSYMVGAIARININRAKLNPEAHEYLESLKLTFPDYNPFHNIFAQMIEVLHSIQESAKLIRELLNADLNNAITKEFQIKEGACVAAVEAPRGTLYYHIDLDQKGYVKNVNIITPTAQFLANLEDDIKAYIPQVLNLEDKLREKKLRAFIRAYDPCISCAVH
jgi:coenzyme F420-reducing hydrogenase alpha subunit